jgi:single-strand DNA-binding protein
MSGSVCKIFLIGNLGRDPDIRAFNDGTRVANFSLATSRSWKDKTSGERKEKTQWHRIVVRGDGLVSVCERFLRKGSKVHLEGTLEYRTYEKDGQEREVAEIVISGFGGELTMLDGKDSGQRASVTDHQAPLDKPAGGGKKWQGNAADLDSDPIPF